MRPAGAASRSPPMTRSRRSLLSLSNLQLVGSDGAGTHSVATLGGYIFDAAETHALPLSHAALDRCVGAHLNGARFSHVARAVRLVPGKSVRAWLRKSAACE